MWSRDERRELGFTVIEARRTNADEVEATATRAVALVTARLGTMTADVERALQGVYENYSHIHAATLREHFSTLGARNAVLETERDALKAELKAEMDGAQHLRDTYGARNDETFFAFVARLAAQHAKPPAPSESSGQVAEDVEAVRWCLTGGGSDAVRAALSRLAAGAQRAADLAGDMRAVQTSMTVHDRAMAAIRRRSLEAANLERMIAEKGLPAMLRYVVDGPQCVACGEEAATSLEQDPPALGAKCAAELRPPYPCSPSCAHDDASSPGHPERVKERSEAVNRALTPEEEAAGDDAYQAAREEGAEAMRAACINEARTLLEIEGISQTIILRVIGRLEGATP